MPAQYTLEYGGQTHDLDVTHFYVITQFERKFDRSFSIMETEVRIEWIAFVCWRAAARQGIPVPLKFDDFLMENPKIETVKVPEGDDANPTDGEQ
jgi:hypothetical protein